MATRPRTVPNRCVDAPLGTPEAQWQNLAKNNIQRREDFLTIRKNIESTLGENAGEAQKYAPEIIANGMMAVMILCLDVCAVDLAAMIEKHGPEMGRRLFNHAEAKRLKERKRSPKPRSYATDPSGQLNLF